MPGLDTKQINSVLLPIKPVFVDKILSGEKTVEFRKVKFKRPVNKLVIYASAPVKKVVAICDIKRILMLSPAQAWSQYKDVAGISKEDYFKYYGPTNTAAVIELGSITTLSNPLRIEQITGSHHTPQSFQYLSISQTNKAVNYPPKCIHEESC